MASKLIYWDSMCFTYRIKRLAKYIADLEIITSAAEKGDIILVTSVFTMAEVAKVSDEETVLEQGGVIESFEEQERKIEAFFENDFIYPVPFDVAICKKAREFVRLFNLKGKDAVHVATAATISGISSFHTYDGKILKASGKIPGNALIIETPEQYHVRMNSGQNSLFNETQDVK